ncbi:Cullin-domain-containing protein [Gigaspora margarita]|uniref:Cullin-domain-containing protein n=1 Tax=Gigaspora margarita TaxID=4874 RepID=A0A8H4AEH2_GIGMA|nr:Cullin-domain-containing protein [Gigaspora margarita]
MTNTSIAIMSFEKEFRNIFSNLPIQASLSSLQIAFQSFEKTQQVEVHSRLKNLYNQYSINIKKTLISKVEQEDAFLEIFVTTWKHFTEKMELIRRSFQYLDPAFQTLGKESIWRLGLCEFRKQVLCSHEINKKNLLGILESIKKQREGEVRNGAILRETLQIYIKLALYDPIEKSLESTTSKYYEVKSDVYVRNLNVYEYLKYVKERIKYERDYISAYLHPRTKDSLLKHVELKLIKRHAKLIWEKIESTFFDIMRNPCEKRGQALTLLYLYLVKIDGVELLQLFIDPIIEKRIELIYEQFASMPLELSSRLNEVKNEIKEMFEEGCDDDLCTAIKEMWQQRVTKYISKNKKINETIAKLIHEFMTSTVNVKIKNLEELLEIVLALLSYMDDKEIFRTLYMTDLVTRLCFEKTSNFELERRVATRLLNAMEPEFSNNLDVMLNDIITSSQINESYNNNYKSNPPLLYANVLTQDSWPKYVTNSTLTVKLAPDLEQAKKAFERVYKADPENKNKKLKWQHELDRCIVEMTFEPKNILISLSLFPTLVLLLFNDLKSGCYLSYEEIKRQTELETAELNRALQSLIFGKIPLLLKDPPYDDIDSTNKFYINESLGTVIDTITDGTENNIITLEDLEVTKRVQDALDIKISQQLAEDRAIQLDSAIMRIIKPEKQIPKALVIQRILQIPRFEWAKEKDVLLRISKLEIDRFIETDKRNRNLLLYKP